MVNDNWYVAYIYKFAEIVWFIMKYVLSRISSSANPSKNWPLNHFRAFGLVYFTAQTIKI